MPRAILFLLLIVTSSTSFADELDKARELINAMEYEQAITIIRSHLSKHQQDIDARYLLARTYAWDNQFDKAELIYNELLAIEADNTQYQFGKAQALIWQNKNPDAIPLLETIIKHVPEESEPWRLLILTLQQSNKPQDKERATHLTTQARARFPKINWDLISN